MLHKIVRNQAPETMRNFLPAKTRERTTYNVRQREHITLPRTSSQAHYRSFLQATIKRWNELPDEITDIPSIEEFKSKITPVKLHTPIQFQVGNREDQILVCRMRVKNADLNLNLFERNLSDSPICLCGNNTETTEHYLLHCQTFTEERRELSRTVLQYTNAPMTVPLLLQGDRSLNEEGNTKVAIAVQEYVKATIRFQK